MIELDGVYDPQSYERRIWDMWMEKGLFNTEPDSSKKAYTILMPPPNVTSQLHMGHGLGYSIQDLMIRWKRMKGFNACWLPGTDHAGIATQMMVEKSLGEQGTNRKELGREAFFQKCVEWKEKYGGIILEQFKSLGFSCDWDRVSYTMDPHLSKAVRYVFVKLFEEGLIYRGERLVNWDPILQTAISDDELENKEINGHLWYFRYPVKDTDEFIPIATTRPETMLGDTAVAVNPEDDRFKHLIGKTVELPFTGRLIPIVADEYVKSEFGTGAVKITPAHDPNDFEIGKRHSLPSISILNDDATLNDAVPEAFVGLDRFVARKEIIKALKNLELFDKEESYKHSVPHSERSKSIIEPKLSLQWYVKMQGMAGEAAELARSGELKMYPESWKKTYLYWLDNIQDWCISRQLWWGHRIPIWYCRDCSAMSTDIVDPTECKKCNSANIYQDEDVLDTWFSSWLWPLSPFGWPEEDPKTKQAMDYYYPSDVLVTAPEIIFLWVARMVMVGKKFMNQVPFKHVYFNATVCDKKGRKFSKTLGNGIDPLEIVGKHGADAVRYTAISLAPLGGRVKMDPNDFDLGARFINKIWNASRFLFRYLEPDQKLSPLVDLKLTLADKWLIEGLASSADLVSTQLDNYRVNDAVDQIYRYIWGCFCDWGVECSKDALAGADNEAKDRVLSVMVYCLEGMLRMASPVIPFVTEELWTKLPAHPDWQREECLANSAFPDGSRIHRYTEEAKDWDTIQEIVSGIRSARAQGGISPKEKLEVHIKCQGALTSLVADSELWINRLAGTSKVISGESVARPSQSMCSVGKGFEAWIPVSGLMDIGKEQKRLKVESNRLTKIISGLEAKLGNENFVKRAPEEVLLETKNKLKNLGSQKEQIELNLSALGD